VGQSPVVLEEEVASLPCKKREEPDILEKEDGEFPKENGSRRSNGMGADAKSYGSEDREPDIRDDHPGKSRSTFHSCHTSVILYAFRFFQVCILL
jgi:peptidyl-prolyl isomerase G (cyclophilin G)